MEYAGTVLVVDDEPAIRDVTHRVLTSAGYRVLTAAHGHEAIGLLEDPELAVDMVLTDVVMPGMTGAAFADQAHAMRPGLPILFMSGYDEQDAPGKAGRVRGRRSSASHSPGPRCWPKSLRLLAVPADVSAGEPSGGRAPPERW